MVWPFRKKPPTYDVEQTNIGNVLRDMGLITEEELQAAALDHIRNKERLGETLIAHGVITKEQLEQALAVQAKLRTDGKEALGQMDILKSQVRRRQITSSNMKAAMMGAHPHP